MPAKRGNRNAAGQRVQRERVGISLSLSEGNGLLALAQDRLASLSIESTTDNIKQYVSEWFYRELERELMRDQRLSVQVRFVGLHGEGETTMSAVAFGMDEAERERDKMIAQLQREGRPILGSAITPDKPSHGSANTKY